ncbi:hypothetical protein [Sphingopyxis sp. PET50]|uniref:hypothetical protein n=1 Tax=Sphingopyxis sp. PET50 TaxID=2976533 RepID=UPI0021AFB30E|nr:hypothetical protein [Sphingopyxis sp. PET50]
MGGGIVLDRLFALGAQHLVLADAARRLRDRVDDILARFELGGRGGARLALRRLLIGVVILLDLLLLFAPQLEIVGELVGALGDLGRGFGAALAADARRRGRQAQRFQTGGRLARDGGGLALRVDRHAERVAQAEGVLAVRAEIGVGAERRVQARRLAADRGPQIGPGAGHTAVDLAPQEQIAVDLARPLDGFGLADLAGAVAGPAAQLDLGRARAQFRDLLGVGDVGQQPGLERPWGERGRQRTEIILARRDHLGPPLLDRAPDILIMMPRIFEPQHIMGDLAHRLAARAGKGARP